jgi:predicted nucleotidyltransferase
MKIFPRNKTDLIIAYILEHPNEIVKVVDIAKTLKVNKGSVSLTVKMLEKEGILENRRVVMKNPTVKALKILINIQKLVNTDAIGILKRSALAAGVYGSSVKGTDTEDSDIDLWIKPKIKISSLDSVKLSRKLDETLGKEVQLLVLDKDKINSIKIGSRNFYNSLLFDSIILFGDGIE